MNVTFCTRCGELLRLVRDDPPEFSHSSYADHEPIPCAGEMRELTDVEFGAEPHVDDCDCLHGQADSRCRQVRERTRG